MNEEIKEYLDSANFKFKDVDEDGNEIELTLSEEMENLIDNNKRLADYIINLQEENERYKKIFEGKERFSKIMPDDMDFIIMTKADYDRQVDDIELTAIGLKLRIDKAIEYITRHDWRKLETDNTYISPSYLLNILQGSEKN